MVMVAVVFTTFGFDITTLFATLKCGAMLFSWLRLLGDITESNSCAPNSEDGGGGGEACIDIGCISACEG